MRFRNFLVYSLFILNPLIASAGQASENSTDCGRVLTWIHANRKLSEPLKRPDFGIESPFLFPGRRWEISDEFRGLFLGNEFVWTDPKTKSTHRVHLEKEWQPGDYFLLRHLDTHGEIASIRLRLTN